jgi:hypothetical protein
LTKAPRIDKWKYYSLIGYDPHNGGQRQVHNSTARFRVPVCGRRWGKSHVAAREFGPKLFIPDTVWWIVGPNYTLAEKEFRIIYRDLVNKLKMGSEIKTSYNVKQGDMRIEMPWGTVLECKSAQNKEGLVGEGLDGVIMSEAAKHERDTWEMYIEPALADKRGEAIFPSTPQGFNWFKGLYELGQMPDMPDYESWHSPTWTNHISFPGGYDDPELTRIRNTVSEQFWRQEYGAEFTTFAGQIYDEFNYDLHVKPLTFNPLWRNYWAFDFGFTDPFVCLDIQVDQMDNVYVWREYQVRGITTYEHTIALKHRENPPNFHVTAMFADPRGADEIATLAMTIGQVFATPVGWILGVEQIKRWLKVQSDGKPKLFIDPSCTELIRQMRNLRAKDQKLEKNAKQVQGQQVGQHDYDDHGPDCLRYFFNEYFLNGAGVRLADVYTPTREDLTFFNTHRSISLGTQF